MFNVMEILSGELILLNIKIPMGCDLMELKLVVPSVQNYGIKKEGVKMIKNCKVCGGEMDCFDRKRSGNKRLGHPKSTRLAYNRVTCSRPCSRENIKIWNKNYCQRPEVKKRLTEYGKKYREKKRGEKNDM